MTYLVSLTSPFSALSAVLPVLHNAWPFQLQQLPLSTCVLQGKGGLSALWGRQPRFSMLSVLAWCRSLNALSDTFLLGHTVQARYGNVPHISLVSSAWSVCMPCGIPDTGDSFSAWSISSFRSWSSFSVCFISLLVFQYLFFIPDKVSCNSDRVEMLLLCKKLTAFAKVFKSLIFPYRLFGCPACCMAVFSSSRSVGDWIGTEWIPKVFTEYLHLVLFKTAAD